jgi:ammonia channel protein AmtB
LGSEGFRKWFPAFFPKSACYKNKIFLAGGILERVVMDAYLVFFVLWGDVIVCYDADVRGRCW